TRAVRGAAPAGGVHPLVVFSHGFSSVREQSTFLTEHLASHGYIVAAPDHQYNTARDLRPFAAHQSALDRPIDLRLVIDWMSERGRNPLDPLYGRIGAERTAAIGHSMGGYTALAVAGALVKTKHLSANLRGPSGAGYFDFRDPRVVACVAFSPLVKPAFDDWSLGRLAAPTMVFGSGDDSVTPFDQHQATVFRCSRQPTWLVFLPGGTHFSYVDLEVLPPLLQMIDRPRLRRDEAVRTIRCCTTAFLNAHLKGDEGGLRAIHSLCEPPVDLQIHTPTPGSAP
ncbi:MAG: alpha/beta hydrolase family protein, partial [Planctomycetia bacterium]